MGRWHPNFAFAVPLAALGFLTPHLPPALTASLLLCSGAMLAFLTLRRAPTPECATIKRTKPPLAATPQPAPLTAIFQSSEIAVQRSAPRAVTLPPKRRPIPEVRDRSWAELMARVNHDLRTPLNAVIGFSEVMVLELFGPLGDQRYQDYVQHIRDSATELLKSAEDTLALTALTASPRRRHGVMVSDLGHLADDAWAFVDRKAAARAISFVASVPAGLEVVGEPRTLRQILVNMFSEAVTRAAHGECIMLTAAVEGELIELGVSVSKERAAPKGNEASLAICLARTMLEMQGSSLIEVASANHGWRAVTVLDRAVQPDFFSCPEGNRPREVARALAG